MGVAIPQVITEDRASSAEIFESSYFLNGDTRFIRNYASAGNRKTWSHSTWIKRTEVRDAMVIGLSVTAASYGEESSAEFNAAGNLTCFGSSNGSSWTTNIATAGRFTDSDGWYHILSVLDTTEENEEDRWRFYINGVRQYNLSAHAYPSLNAENYMNATPAAVSLCSRRSGGSNYKGYMTETYFFDGQAMRPEKFGYLDPNTNTWRPKKFVSGNDGTTFSSFLTSNTTINAPTSAFDGLVTNAAYTNALDGATITFTPPTPIQGKVIEIRAYGSYAAGAQIATLNDGQASVAMTIGKWHILSSDAPTTIRKIEVQANGAGAQASIAAIRVDGQILKDSTSGGAVFGTNGFYLPMDNKSPAELDQSGNNNHFDVYSSNQNGNQTTLDKATGGIPILRTNAAGTQGGGVRTVCKNVVVTVVSTGEGNKYFFDGVRYSPGTYPLIRGGTYFFDQSDASNGTGGTHPLRFATAADAAGSTEYTDGVTQNGTPGTAGAYTKITVPHNAPDTLYYYCTNHGGMGGPTENTTDIRRADPFAWKCVLATPMTRQSQNNFQDESNILRGELGNANAKVITNNNGTSTNTLTQRDSNFYGHSARFDGTTSNIYHSIPDSADLDFGSDDFTIEFWFKQNGTGTSYIWGDVNNSFGAWAIYCNTNAGSLDNIISVGVSIGSNHFLNNSFINDQWNHGAFVRYNDVLTFYVNGSKGVQPEQDVACSGSYNNLSNGFTIGRAGLYTSNPWGSSGNNRSYLQDFRIYKGVAKYTEEFSVPVTRPTTPPESPSGVAYGSNKPTKSGSWEPGFGGSGYIEYPASSDGDFTLDADFTIEFWFRSKKWNSNQNLGLFGIGNYGTQATSLTFLMDTVGRPQLLYGAVTQSFNDYVELLCRFNCWHHIAITRSGATISVFMDGIRNGTCVIGTIGSATTKLVLNSYLNTNGPEFQNPGMYDSWVGAANISNFRIIKGECLYTNHFEPPTEPFEVTANTKILTCNNSENYYKCIRGSKLPNYGNASAYAMWPLDSDINDDSGNNRTLTENGGSTTFISAPANNFGITNCATFPSNGKYLSYAVSPSSEWTFDCYVYPVSATSAPYIMGWNGTSGSNCSLGLDENPWNGGGGNGNSPINVFSWSIFGAPNNLNTIKEVVFNQWHHIRITSSSSLNLNLYVDGEHIGALPDDSTPASPITFGDVQPSRFNGHFAGVRYVEKDLGAPDPDNIEVTVSGVTSNTPPIGPSPHTSQLHPYSDASSNDPFVDDIRMLMGPATGHAVLSSQPQENSNGPQVMTNGNLTYDLVSDSSSGYYRFFYSSLGIPQESGKWYWEFELPGNDNVVDPTYSQPLFGLTNQYFGPTESHTVWGNQLSAMAGSGYAQKYGYNGTWKMGDDVNVTGGIFGTPAGTMGMMYDSDTGDLTLYHNGEKSMTWDTLPTDRTYWPFWETYYIFDTANGYPHNVNFGQHPFRFPPPHGAKTLCLTNLQRANKVAMNPDDHFTTINSWGNGSTNYPGVQHIGQWSKDLISTPGTYYSTSSYGPCQAFSGTDTTYVSCGSNAAGEKLIFAPETPIYFHSGLEIKLHSSSSAVWNGNFVNPGSTTFATFTSGAGVISKDFPIIISTTAPGVTEATFQCIRINGSELLTDVKALTAAKTKFPKGLWWTKNRLGSTDQNQLVDSIRGESARSTCPTLATWGAYTTPPGQTVAWAWSAPEDFTGSSNTTCSRNLDAGFSMIKADAGVTTIQHGLSKAPDFIISAPDSNNNIFVHSVALSRYWGSTRYGTLDTSVAFGASDATLYDGNPTDTQFVVGSNMSTPACMHYCWHEIEGYCKTGVYRGNNGNADGPYANLGFMPRWILLKAVTRTGDWKIFDKVRDPQNPCSRRLNPNAASVEGEEVNVDFLSSGFKIRGTLTDVNGNAETYIYLAFAAMPTSLPYAGQCDAR